MLNWLQKFFNNETTKDMSILSINEQYTFLNSQIENIYNLIFNTNKFYSTLLTSVVGVAVLLYTNNILPTDYFNYLYYIVLLVYSISIIWYRTLIMYLYDLNKNTKKYNSFIQDNKIISMYNLSIPINVRKCALQLPFFIGSFCVVILLKYSVYCSIFDWILAIAYVISFYFAYIHKFDIRILKYL